MTGQRSRAEMKAKDDLSRVVYKVTGILTLDTMFATNQGCDWAKLPNSIDWFGPSCSLAYHNT